MWYFNWLEFDCGVKCFRIMHRVGVVWYNLNFVPDLAKKKLPQLPSITTKAWNRQKICTGSCFLRENYAFLQTKRRFRSQKSRKTPIWETRVTELDKTTKNIWFFNCFMEQKSHFFKSCGTNHEISLPHCDNTTVLPHT